MQTTIEQDLAKDCKNASETFVNACEEASDVLEAYSIGRAARAVVIALRHLAEAHFSDSAVPVPLGDARAASRAVGAEAVIALDNAEAALRAARAVLAAAARAVAALNS